MIKIDKNKCVGCGACVSLAPTIFTLSSDGTAKVKNSEKCNEKCKMATEYCPVGAISC